MDHIIKTCGQTHPMKVYKAVTTYKQLLKTNVAFLDGLIAETPYHDGAIDAETVPLVHNLRMINENGFYSIEGQPPYVEYNKFVDKVWKNSQGQPQGNWYYDGEHKSYIVGCLPCKQFTKFREFMGNQTQFYYNAFNPDGTMIVNTYPISKYNVTRERSHTSQQQLADEPWNNYTNIHADKFSNMCNFYADFRNIRKLLKECVFMTIACKEYGDASVETLLLKFFNQPSNI